MGLSFIEEYFSDTKTSFYSIWRHIVNAKGRHIVIKLSVHLNVHMDLNRVQSISPILFEV